MDRFPNCAGLFLAALAHGWPWEVALRLFSGLKSGRIEPEGTTFAPRRCPSTADCVGASAAAFGATLDACAPVCLSASFPFGGGTVNVFSSSEGVALVRSTVRLCPAPDYYLRGCRLVLLMPPGPRIFPLKIRPGMRLDVLHP
jgi:hypothetical protein